ncbi:MAG: anaerobic selenocysteine-containing dehydrogenase [Sulfurimonas sp.]|jgi:anaerobic selenocysteine-containing dehydrogenase
MIESGNAAEKEKYQDTKVTAKNTKYPKSVKVLPDGSRIVQTNCFECHSKCGVLVYVDANEQVYKITGNPDNPQTQGAICSKAQAGKKILNHPDRVNYPIKRVGEKGEGKWERISWDEALNTISEKLINYKKELGPESVVFGQGTGRGTNQWNQRLGKSFGMNHWCCPAHICLLPQMMTSMITLGMFSIWDGAEYEHSECIVLWGSNPSWTEGSFTNTPMGKARKNGAKLIVIDPNFEHPLAHKADYWLPIKPGTDGALALAWMRLMIKENLYDKDFVYKWTNSTQLIEVGTNKPIVSNMVMDCNEDEKFMVYDNKTGKVVPMGTEGAEPELEGIFEVSTKDGKTIQATTAWSILLERVEPYTPEYTAEITWLKPDQIREAGRLYAKSSPGACINQMQGIEEHANSWHTIRDICCVIALAGNVDVKGGNVFIPFWNEMLGPRLTGEDPEIQKEKKLGDLSLYPVSQPSAVWDAILTEKPYPIKAYIGIQGNPLSWCEDPAHTEKALRKVEFLVVMDYFISPTAELADIVLPSAHWLERDYVADELTARYFFAQQKSIEPLFERKSDIWFMRELGRRIAPEAWPWETEEELFDWQLETDGVTWDELKDKQFIKYAPEVYRTFEKRGAFETPSGKVELFSNVASMSGAEPMPLYVAPPASTKEYPLIAVTGRRYSNFYHSAYRNISWLRELSPFPMVMINPRTATSLNIKQNDLVWIESSTGKVQMFAELSNGVHPSVISAPHGWWQGCEELGLPSFPNHISNINIIVDRTTVSPEFGSPEMRAKPVKMYKADKSHIPDFPYLNLDESEYFKGKENQK